MADEIDLADKFAKLRKVGRCLYIAVDKSVTDAVSAIIEDALEAAEARIAELEIVGRRFYDAVLAVSEPALRNENEPPKETLDRLTDTAREFKAILTPGTPGEAE